MPIIAVENPWTLPIEEVLYAALTLTGHPRPVGIATRSQRHYAVSVAGPVKSMGYRLEEVKTPPEIPEGTEVRWDGWIAFADTTIFKLLPLFEKMEEQLGKAREIKWHRQYMGFPSERMPKDYERPAFDLVRVDQACSGGGHSPDLKFPEASDEPALMELYLYPNPSRLPLPDLVSNVGKVEGLMGITNKSGGLMRNTVHGLLYSPDARLGFDLKGLTNDLEAWGFFVLEAGFDLMREVLEGLSPVNESRRCVLEEIGVTLPSERVHYEHIC
jgi:hypothetical protein